MSIFLSKETVSAYRREGTSFHCPRGHSLSFPDTTQKKLNEANRQIAQKDMEMARMRNEIRMLEGENATKDRKIKRLTKKKK